jgi:HIRAN domain
MSEIESKSEIKSTSTYTAPIVGMAFRPPAAAVMQQLPFETKLLLKREPENEYDSNAIRVLLPGFSANGIHKDLFESCFEQALPDEFEAGRGVWNRCQLTNPLHLGYVKAKDGPAAEISALLDARGISEIEAKLSATETGQPAAHFTLENVL